MEESSQQDSDGRGGESAQPDAGCGRPGQRGHGRHQRLGRLTLAGANRRHHQDRAGYAGCREMRQKSERGGVGPVQVLQHQHQRRLGRRRGEQPADRVEQSQQSAGVAIDLTLRGRRPRQQRHQRIGLVGVIRHLGQTPRHGKPRPEGRREVRMAAAHDNPRAVCLCQRTQVLDQA